MVDCDHALWTIFYWSCIIFGTLQISSLHYNLVDVFLYLCTCLCLLCNVVCMHNVHSAHIFIVYNSMICTKSFNILSILYNGHIVDCILQMLIVLLRVKHTNSNTCRFINKRTFLNQKIVLWIILWFISLSQWILGV